MWRSVIAVDAVIYHGSELEFRRPDIGCGDRNPQHFVAPTGASGELSKQRRLHSVSRELRAWPLGGNPRPPATVPAGWTSTEEDSGEFNLHPSGLPNESVFFWLNMAAVKSTGPGHGTTILTKVGTSPSGLVHWLTTNADFRIVVPPTKTSLGDIPVTTLVVGVSRTARYGDPACPDNPHCADFLTNPTYWPPNDSYGIGGSEEVRLFLGRYPHGTIMVALDANNPSGLKHLETAAQPILKSARLPHVTGQLIGRFSRRGATTMVH